MSKIEPPEFKSLKPIYPVEVISVACRALEMLALYDDQHVGPEAKAIAVIATRIISDGLLSHEIAIKGES
jgi:hypothetical protein